MLVIAEAADSFDGPAVLVLRLRRFSKLNPTEQADVRAGRAQRLFHLRPDRFPGLPEENAALVSDLVRTTRSALDDEEELGALGDNELRVLHERIVRYYDLDLTVLVRQLLDDRLPEARG